jgi:AcrR family transcriptional regulator
MVAGVKPRRQRRPRNSLSREQVVHAALALADRNGLEALTMPILARELDCGVMTLYGHIDNKDDLVDAIALRGLADLRLRRPLPSEPAGILLAWGQALRATLLHHPSLAVIFLSRPVIGPGIFDGIEALVGTLVRSGMQPTFGLQAIYAVLIYTTGFVAWELSRTRNQSVAAYSAHWRREFAHLSPEKFPVTSSIADALPRVAGAEQFDVGLRALAAGLETLAS